MRLSTHKYQAGFGLVELMATVAIIAILVTLAAPGFGTLLQTNTLTESANRFLSGMAVARNEAVSRNTEVVMCQLNAAGNACGNDGRWENGWRIWVDVNGNNAFDAATDDIVNEEDALPEGYTLRVSNNQFTNDITYNSTGSANGTNGNGAEIFRLCEPSADVTISKSIHLNGIGRAWVNSTPGTTACP
jgi:type IV fimbrial biogenesis protein FimT